MLPASRRPLALSISHQPDPTTCGPTCLQAVYAFYGDKVALPRLVAEVPSLYGGGTIAAGLAVHALRRGYRAEIVTANMQLFDPTWFSDPKPDLARRLAQQAEVKDDPKLQAATELYGQYLALGGTVRFERITSHFIREVLDSGRPILTGLSATYLYASPREVDDRYDDVEGEPVGHFVVLAGEDPAASTVRVLDPLEDTPTYPGHAYDVPIEHLLGAIFLGILTYDANLLIITPNESER